MPRARAERACALAALVGAVVLAAPASSSAAPPDAGTSLPGAIAPTPIVDHVVRHVPPGFDDASGKYISVHAGDPLNLDAVRDSIKSLYATGKFSDVIVRIAGPDGGNPTVIFDLVAQERIQNMTFLGAPTLARADLVRAALEGLVPAHGLGVTTGLPAPFYPEEVEAMRRSLESALDRRGYSAAHVVGHVEPLSAVNVDLQFDIDEGPPTRIASIKFTGDTGLPVEALVPPDFLHVGDILDREAIDRALDTLRTRYQKDAFYRARVGAPQVSRSANGERADVTLPVEAGPAITFGFRGNHSFSTRELEQQVELVGDETLDADGEEGIARKVHRFYVLSGFADARVQPEELWSLDRRHMTVVFDIDEGVPLRVTQRHVVGEQHFSESFLLDRVDESLQTAVPRPLDVGQIPLEEGESAQPASDRQHHVEQYRVEPSSVFAEEPYQDAINRIVALYNADGYLEARVTNAAVEVDDAHRTAAVTLSITEGPLTHVGKVALDELQPDGGAVPDATQFLEAQTSLRSGQPYSSFAEENARVALERALRHEGYLFAKVSAKEATAGPDKTIKDLYFEAKLGDRVRVRSIIVTGNTRTREGIIDANIALKEGDIFDPDLMEKTQRNLTRLGLFTRVTVEPLGRDDPDPEKDLLVSVDERPRLELTHGPGLSLVDGPRYTVDLSLNNVEGQGFSIVALGKVDYFNWSYPVLSGLDGLQAQTPPYDGIGGNGNVGLRSPGLFNSPVDGHIDAVGGREDRPAFYFESFAVLMGLDWHIATPLIASINVSPYEYDFIHRQESYAQIFTAPSGVSTSELQDLRLDPGVTRLATVTPAITLDFRDNATNPHRGFWASANTEFAHSLVVDEYHFLFYAKPTVTLKGYIPLGKATLGLTASGGRVAALAANSTTPATKRFFLGGATTLRGYSVDGLIPEDDRAEYHQEVANCRAAFSPVGCTDTAKVIDQGDLWPSFGGQAFVLYKAEIRFPLIGSLEGGIFIDIGDLWDIPPTLAVQFFQVRTLRYTPGIGIHYNTPLGPLSLDFGINPNPDTLLNETALSLSYLQFSIGQF